MNNSITAFDAKTHFSKLLERASRGEEILITRRGKPAAKLVPINDLYNIEIAETAAINLRKLAKEVNANPGDWEEWQNYKHLGRK